MLDTLTGPILRSTSIPDDYPCRWRQLGDRPWELLTSYTHCPHHGLVDRTAADIEAVLDWLANGWIGDPPSDLMADVEACRHAAGWLPADPFARIHERVMEHATPTWLWPVVLGVVATARPAPSAWPPPERLDSPMVPYPEVPMGRVG